MIRVQTHAFDTAAELARLKQGRTDIGGSVVFVGTMRDISDGATVSAMTLEHYPGMTEKALEKIIAEAGTRWKVLDCTVIHRHGTLRPTDQIVLVVVASAHRGDAFAACEFIMDYLKTQAPFWKKEAAGWVEARAADDQAAARWK